MVDEDIHGKRPILEQCIVAATEMMQQCMPEEAQVLQTKVDSLQARLTQVSDTSKSHQDQLSSLKSRLDDFEGLVDELEEWLLPLLDKVEIKEFMQQELSTIGDQLRVSY